eukprot:371138-Hanusia_phi.AAC.3
MLRVPLVYPSVRGVLRRFHLANMCHATKWHNGVSEAGVIHWERGVGVHIRAENTLFQSISEGTFRENNSFRESVTVEAGLGLPVTPGPTTVRRRGGSDPGGRGEDFLYYCPRHESPSPTSENRLVRNRS